MDISNLTFTNILHEVNQPTHIEGASAPPYVMGTDEQNFQTEFRMRAYDLVKEMNHLRLGENNHNPSHERPPSTPQDVHPFQVPMVQLYKANSEGQRAQFDILPEEFNPKCSRLPYLYTRSLGRSAPFLLAPVEGWGALRAPTALRAVLGAFGPQS